MLRIVITDELWDKEQRIFLYPEVAVLELEHSLVSVSKWERIVKKPFLTQEEKSTEEALLYIECMTLSPDFDPEVLKKLSKKNMREVTDYIQDPMTATWFSETGSGGASSQVITADLIYSWMVAYEIEFEAQYWHLNQLITLIKVIDHQRASHGKKRSPAQVAMEQSRLAAERRRKYEGG